MTLLASRRTLFAALLGFGALSAAGAASAQAAPATPAAPAPAPAPLTAEERARYVGSYEVSMGDNTDLLVVYEENGNLFAQPPGMSRPSQLNRKSGDVFEPAVAPGATFTFSVADGKVTGFVLAMPDGMRLEGIRK
jgi:hypothetical protein